MAINNVNNSGVTKTPLDNSKVSQQGQNQATQQHAAAKADAASVPRQDSVSLTQSAQQLNQVQKRSAEAPIDQEKVEKLKKAIENGEYRINAEALASKIASMESDLFGKA